MARPKKPGLDYFPKDTDEFESLAMRKLLAKHQAAGYLVYEYVKADCFRYNGYWALINEDYIFNVSDKLRCVSIEDVSCILQTCAILGLFDSAIFHSQNIITSELIQKTYQAVKPSGIISDKIRVIGEKVHQGGINEEITGVSSESIPQSKVKESKVKESRDAALFLNETPAPLPDGLAGAPELTGPPQGIAPTVGGYQPPPVPPPPTLQQVQEFFMQSGGTPDSAQRFFQKHEGLRWRNGITPIANWRMFALTWIGDAFGVERRIAEAKGPPGGVVHQGDEWEKNMRRVRELMEQRGASG